MCVVCQVTLEEQMICGALQTLNEEACEDVLDVPSPSTHQTDSLQGEPPSSLPLKLPLVIVQEVQSSEHDNEFDNEYNSAL